MMLHISQLMLCQIIRQVYKKGHVLLPMQIYWSSMMVKLILGFLWYLIHLVISVFNLWYHMCNNLECYLISSELLPKFRNLRFERLKYLGVVVDSREANNILKVKQLLWWLSTLGVKYVILYDVEGVLKKLLEPGIKASRDGNSRNSINVSANMEASHFSHGGMAVECLSGSDGKEGIAKAANLLYSDFCNCATHGSAKSDIVFTEADMACALRAAGSGGAEPDLLLVYGPVRCHLGFPAWRLRYTEIVHMGSLKSMKYGSIVKAFYRFSEKYQNYALPPYVGAEEELESRTTSIQEGEDDEDMTTSDAATPPTASTQLQSEDRPVIHKSYTRKKHNVNVIRNQGAASGKTASHYFD